MFLWFIGIIVQNYTIIIKSAKKNVRLFCARVLCLNSGLGAAWVCGRAWRLSSNDQKERLADCRKPLFLFLLGMELDLFLVQLEYLDTVFAECYIDLAVVKSDVVG